MNHAPVAPFTIAVPQAELDDLQARLSAARLPDPDPAATRAAVTTLAPMSELIGYWRDGYDWRGHEAELNSWPQVTTEVDGQRLHAIHAPASAEVPLAVVLLHGWPSTFAEFRKIIPDLTAPGRPGQSPVHVVAPSLPGFGFSGPTGDGGWDARRMAAAIAELMHRLGYERYIAHGGDIGAEVATQLALADPAHVAGIHLNMGGIRLTAENLADASGDEREHAAVAKYHEYLADKSAYALLQSTRPQTLAYALTDSPAGQLAWIAEKFEEWAGPETPVDRDDILTAASIYWFTRTAASSARYYRQSYGKWDQSAARIEVPTAVAAFPNEIVPPVRRWAERRYEIVRWVDMPAGGHFSALETPGLVAAAIREFAALLGEHTSLR